MQLDIAQRLTLIDDYYNSRNQKSISVEKHLKIETNDDYNKTEIINFEFELLKKNNRKYELKWI